MNRPQVLESSDRAGAARAPQRPTVAARPAGSLAFRIPAGDAHRVRQALTALPGCAIERCMPHPFDREVALWITFALGAQRALMDLLMACVPCGQFGRIIPAATPVH